MQGSTLTGALDTWVPKFNVQTHEPTNFKFFTYMQGLCTQTGKQSNWNPYQKSQCGSLLYAKCPKHETTTILYFFEIHFWGWVSIPRKSSLTFCHYSSFYFHVGLNHPSCIQTSLILRSTLLNYPCTGTCGIRSVCTNIFPPFHDGPLTNLQSLKKGTQTSILSSLVGLFLGYQLSGCSFHPHPFARPCQL